MTVRPLLVDETERYFPLRTMLWPDADAPEEITQLLADPEAVIFVAEVEGRLVGFAEGSLRRYADGCESSPVGYLEGWYVRPEYRQHGVGRKLVGALEGWARARGCTEMASDTELHNTLSQQAHARLGFEEVERIVQFRKPL
ncbi:MAG: aminoglycoside 6'-N-acetyltransferase [Meiothermus sp.]|nr:aminoglycoside 6'-N-acetyltransferase [Meiothermus sp.]